MKNTVYDLGCIFPKHYCDDEMAIHWKVRERFFSVFGLWKGAVRDNQDQKSASPFFVTFIAYYYALERCQNIGVYANYFKCV